MNYITLLVKHSELSPHQIEQICNLKAVRWNYYSLEQHRQWMVENLQPSDYHILLIENAKLFGYTNLVEISATINDEVVFMKGVGNVCTLETGKGYGNVLMQEVNRNLTEHYWIGLLICKQELVKYYDKFGWVVIDKGVCHIDNLDDVNFMIYNVQTEISSFTYEGRNF